LSDDIDISNEADSKSEDTPTTFAMEPLVAYLDDPYCNNTVETNGEWVLDEDIDFDYFLCFDDVPDSANTSSLHMPIPTSISTRR